MNCDFDVNNNSVIIPNTVLPIGGTGFNSPGRPVDFVLGFQGNMFRD